MYRRRYLPVTFAGPVIALYGHALSLMHALWPLWRWLGRARTGRLFAGIEKPLKGLMFDCQMCGQCILGQTGAACPMNCPKSIRNGPCGGVRQDGTCEVDPRMRCVWVEAWRGSRSSPRESGILAVQPPSARNKMGHSSWLADLEARRGDTLPGNQ